MFSRYVEWSGHSIDVSSDINLYAFTDRYDVASWAVESMMWAIYAGVIDVTDSTALNPSSNATRAEIASMVVQMIELVEMLTYEQSQTEPAQAYPPATEQTPTPQPPPASGSGGGAGSGGGSGTPHPPPPTPPEIECESDSACEPECECEADPKCGEECECEAPPPPVEDDFILTISVEDTRVQQVAPFWVTIELKNNSGQDVEIASYSLFYPHIPGEAWTFERRPLSRPSFRLFESGSTISRIIPLAMYYEHLLPGDYELTVRAMFYLGWEQPVDPASEPTPWQAPDSTRRISLESNIIEITVLPPEPPPVHDDFTLTISVVECTLTRDQLFHRNFEFYLELENNSGKDLEIIAGVLFWPRIPNWRPCSTNAYARPETMIFPKDGVIRREPVLSSPPFDAPVRFGEGSSGFYGVGNPGRDSTTLPVGTHELIVEARFYVVCEQGGERERIVVTDTAVLTVLPPLPPPTADDFILTVSVEETSLPQGESFFGVSIELKNNSGRDISIDFRQLLRPYIPRWRSDDSSLDTPPMHIMTFRANSVIRNNSRFPPFDTPTIFLYGGGSGYYAGQWVEWLPVGVYELSASTVFYVLREDGNKRIELTSNTVEVTVLP